MRTLLAPVSLVAATVATALLAGTFYGFTVAVVPGLARADPRSAVAVMREINVAVVNPWFMLAFLGSPVLIAVALLVRVLGGGPGATTVAIGSALVLCLAALAVTAAVHIPLNNVLAGAAHTDPDVALGAFLGSWSRWNLVRTLCTAGATGILAWAAVTGSPVR